jgi:hypothetical protein
MVKLVKTGGFIPSFTPNFRKTGGNVDFTWDETFGFRNSGFTHGFTDSQLTRGRSQLWESSDPTVNVSWCFREHLPSGSPNITMENHHF